ncbi:MAG TPA: hypothetical protein VHT24_02400 [Pseudacidobacterium sp.]|jgi:hypothetical protein|nr:hypothetical protein [Pseudacidobacterium sp.]
MANYRNAFETDVEAFLAKYAMSVQGGSVQATVSGTTVGQEITAAGFAPTQKLSGGTAKTAVSLTAPLLTANFTKLQPRDHKDYFDFSAAQITVQLDQYNGAADLPVYLIPYEGGTARGVKLPAHSTDPFAVAYAMTATQNGCTVEVSGPAASPYASHTNVIDVNGVNADQRWANRETKINLRLFRLQNRFAAAENAVGGNSGAPALNRTQFGFFDPSAPGGVPVNQFVNYSAQMTKVANAQADVTNKTLMREEGFLSHFRYYAIPTQDTIDSCRNRKLPPQALVVGRRDNAGWKFYYQVWRPMRFYINRVRKVKGLQLGGGEYLLNNKGNRKSFSITVVLDYGELWPDHTEHNNTFGGGI